MKIPVLLVSAMALSGACNKHGNHTAATLSPQIKVGFGRLNVFFIDRFWNQDSVGRDSLAMQSCLGIELHENNLPRSVYSTAPDQLDFVFDAYTDGDREHYNSKQSAYSKSNTHILFGEYSEIESGVFVPIRMTITARPGNDTLEFSPLGDCIKIDYASQYANVRTRDSIFVIP